MKIVGAKKIVDYGRKHADAKKALDSWHNEAKHACWKVPDDVRGQFPRASIVGDDRVVFRIRGNHFRIVVVVKYTIGNVYIRFVGTHAEYDKIDVKDI
jgi:mRNA interferase HigB